jgi:hypothetical protein
MQASHTFPERKNAAGLLQKTEHFYLSEAALPYVNTTIKFITLHLPETNLTHVPFTAPTVWGLTTVI